MIKKFLILLCILFQFIVFHSSSQVQDYTQWHLPDRAIMRIGKGGINDMMLSPDGTQLAVGTDIGVWIYDAHTGTEISLLKVNPRGVRTVNCIAFSPDGNTLAIGNWVLGGAVELWDVNKGELITVMKERIGRVKSLVFSPDGRLLTCLSWNRNVEYHMWEIESGREVLSFTGDQVGLFNGLALSPDSNYIASAARGELFLWDPFNKEKLHTIPYEGWSLAISPDSKILVGGSTTLKSWDTKSGEELLTYEGHTRNVESIVFAPDGNTFASGDTGGKINLWNLVPAQHIEGDKHPQDIEKDQQPSLAKILRSITGNNKTKKPDKLLKRTLMGHTLPIKALHFSTDGEKLVSGSDDGTAKIWEVNTGNEPLTILGHTGSIKDIQFINNGTTLLSGGSDGVITQTNLDEAGISQEIIQTKPPWYAFDMIFSKDGKTVASGCWGDVRLWNTETQKFYPPLGKYDEFVLTLAFSPDEKLLGSGHWRGRVFLWDVPNRKLYKTLDGHTEDVRSVAFSPNGKWFASGSKDGTVNLWNLDDFTKTTLPIQAENGFEEVVFTPENNLITALWNGEIKVWNTETKEHIGDFFDARGTPSGLDISPDGKNIITGSHSGLIRIYDMESRSLSHQFSTGDSAGTTKFAFSPDGSILVSGSNNGTLLLWDLEDMGLVGR
ncbi:WD40 repeat domain-containing protein [Candidatus Poribacteria bacterium]|nr:WD40 repeat domain-containing protein [Candidatus Poribacteria bacterium]